MFKTIYLDNGATTKPDKKVVEAMLSYLKDNFGNASSAHSIGFNARDALDNSRNIIAKTLSAKPEEIVFTSGGTESNNQAIKGIAFANKNKGNHIITTKVEHKCVLNACKWLETQGFKITYLDVDKVGLVSLDDLQRAITSKTILVSIIHANNEIGTIQDIEAIGKVCKKNKVYFHTDACQSFTKIPINTKNIDLITINSHKINGPKGVGALFVKKGTKIDPLLHGGGQEENLRSGTENIPGIVGFAKAVKISKNRDIKVMTKLRDMLIDGLLEIENSYLNGPKVNRLCNNVNIRFDGIEGEALGGYLDRKFICSSTGSACNTPSQEPSYVLKAICLSGEQAQGSIRLTLSRYTTEDEVKKVIRSITSIVKKLRKPSLLKKVFHD